MKPVLDRSHPSNRHRGNGPFCSPRATAAIDNLAHRIGGALTEQVDLRSRAVSARR